MTHPGRRVESYPFALTDARFTLPLPLRAEVLSVLAQVGAPCLLALVDPEAATSVRTFHVVDTGHPMTDASVKYVGTLHVGARVRHVFEILP